MVMMFDGGGSCCWWLCWWCSGGCYGMVVEVGPGDGSSGGRGG